MTEGIYLDEDIWMDYFYIKWKSYIILLAKIKSILKMLISSHEPLSLTEPQLSVK